MQFWTTRMTTSRLHSPRLWPMNCDRTSALVLCNCARSSSVRCAVRLLRRQLSEFGACLHTWSIHILFHEFGNLLSTSRCPLVPFLFEITHCTGRRHCFWHIRSLEALERNTFLATRPRAYSAAIVSWSTMCNHLNSALPAIRASSLSKRSGINFLLLPPCRYHPIAYHRLLFHGENEAHRLSAYSVMPTQRIGSAIHTAQRLFPLCLNKPLTTSNRSFRSASQGARRGLMRGQLRPFLSPSYHSF